MALDDDRVGLQRRSPPGLPDADSYTARAQDYLARQPTPTSTDRRSDFTKELEAAAHRTTAWAPAAEGLVRRLAGDDAGADSAYALARQREEFAASRDSDVDANLLNARGVGDVAAGARKLFISSGPTMIAGLGAAGIGRGLARRAAMNAERKAVAADTAANMSAVTGVQSPAARVAAAQQREAAQAAATAAVRRDPAAMARVERAGNIGTFVGGTAGTLPTMVAGSREYLEDADREQTLAILGHDTAAAAVGFLPMERLMGRVLNRPGAPQALEKNIRAQLKGAAKKTFREGGVQALWEGGSEAAQALIQRAGHKYVDDNIELFSREALDEYVANFVGGAVLGGVMGASTEAGMQAVDIGGDVGGTAYRWTRDRAGEAKVAIKERLRAAADKVRAREAEGQPAAPGQEATGAGAADLFNRARDGLTGAAKRFQDAWRSRQNDADLDTQADEIITLFDDMLEDKPDSGPLGPLFSQARTTTQQLLLGRLNPEFVASSREEDVLRLGRIMEKYVTGKELAAVEARTLQRVVALPGSGVSQKLLDTFASAHVAGMLPNIKGMARRMSQDVGDEQYARQDLDPNEQAREVTRSDDGDVDPETTAVQNTFGMAETGAGEKMHPLDRMNSALNELRAMRQRGAIDDDAREMAKAEARSVAAGNEPDNALPEDTRRYADLLIERARLAEGLRRDILGELSGKTVIEDGKKVFRSAKNSAVYTEFVTRDGDVSDKSRRAFEARRRDPDTVEIEGGVEYVADGQKQRRRALLDLGRLIRRQQAQIRSEGTADENVPARVALLRGLAEANEVGIRVNLDTLRYGKIVDSKTGRAIITITGDLVDAMREATQPKRHTAPTKGRVVGSPDADLNAEFLNTTEEGAAILDRRASEARIRADRAAALAERARGQRKANLRKTAEGLREAQDELTQRADRSREEYAGEAAIDRGDYYSEQRVLRAREAPRGVLDQGSEAGNRRRSGLSRWKAKGRELRDAIEKARGNERARLEAALEHHRTLRPNKSPPRYAPAKTAVSDARRGDFVPDISPVSNVSFDSPHEQVLNEFRRARDAAKTPDQRTAAIRQAGEKIGSAELARELETGLISQGTFERLQARLIDPGTKSAERYLQRALRGDFDSVSVSHASADKAEPAKGKDADREMDDAKDITARSERLGQPKHNEVRARRERLQEAAAKKAAAKPAPKKAAPKKAPAKKAPTSTSAKATLEALKPKLVTDDARFAADIAIKGEFELADGSTVAIPAPVIDRVVSMAQRIADGWATYPANGTFSEQSAWFSSEGHSVPQPSELRDVLNQAYRAAEAVSRFGVHPTLSAAEAPGKLFEPGIIKDWVAKRGEVDGVTDMENLCLATSESTVWLLQAHGYSAARAHAGVTIPGGDPNGRHMDHYVAVAEIDGQHFIVDQPQSELFTPTGEGNKVRIKQREFRPRFIPVSEAAAAYNTPGFDFNIGAGQEFESLPIQDFAEPTSDDDVPQAPKKRVVKKGADAKAKQDQVAQLKKTVAAEKAAEAKIRAEAQAAAAAIAASEPTKHNYKREGGLALSVLRALGYTDKQIPLITVKPYEGKGKAGGYRYRLGHVMLGDALVGRERMEVLAHEIGHAIIAAEISKATGVPVDQLLGPDGKPIGNNDAWMEALAQANPELYAALRADYDAFRGQHSELTSFDAMRAARSGPARAASVRRQGRATGRSGVATGLLPGSEYQLSMNEWLADHLGRAVLQHQKGASIVEKFFADIARQLRRAYDLLFKGAGADNWRPAPSVEAWVAQLFDPNVRAVRGATGKAGDAKSAKAAVEAATIDATRGDPPAEPPGPPSDGDTTATPLGREIGFTQLMRYVRTYLPPQEQHLVLRMANTAAARKVLQEFYAPFPRIIQAMDRAAHGDEAKIAALFILWREGVLQPGSQSGAVLQTIKDELQRVATGGGGQDTRTMGDDIAKLLGLADTDNYVERIFQDLATGKVERFRRLGGYDVRKIEGDKRGARQKAWNAAVRHFDRVNDALGKYLDGKGQRLRNSGIAAFRRLNAMLQKPSGTTGEDPGFIAAKRNVTSRYTTRLRAIHGNITPRESVRAMTLLQRGATDLSNEPFPVREAVEKTRAVLDDLFDYMKDAGVDVGRRENFFPVMLEVTREVDRQKLRTLLSDPFYEADIREFFGGTDEDGNRAPSEQPIAELVENLVNGAATSTDYSPSSSTTDPKFRGQNYRSMQFIYDAVAKAKASDNAELEARMEKNVATFASLQTKDPAALMARYVEPAIARAEYVRRFGENNAKLDKLLAQAKAQGASEAQLAEARDAVKAATGTYGAEGSPTLAAISPTLSKKLSGPRVKALVHNLQAYQNVRLLPLSLLSSLVDPMGIAVRSGGDFGSAWEAYKIGLRGVFDKATRQEQEAALSVLGAASDMFAEVAITQPGETSFSNRVNEFLFRVNGLQAWTKATRFMALEAAHAFILKHDAGHNELSSVYMRELGLRPGDVRRTTGFQAYGRGGSMVMGEKVDVLSEAQLEGLRARAKAGDRAAKAELARDERVRNALMQFVDEAILRPNAMQTPMWVSDPYMGLISQYKAFAYALYDQIYRRSAIEADRGNNRVFGAMLMYIPVVLAAEILREMIQNLGGDERRKDWGVMEYTALAAERTGLYSPRFDAAKDAWEDVERKKVPGTSQLGPTASQAGDVYDAFRGRRDLGEEFQRALPGAAVHRRWDEAVGL